ncbi:MAG: hypothetical protein KGL97_03355 [Alphaproteobacteria bacterium]|nr:hypothetical protein [Alphaproteobacteria bacterium]
MDIGTLFGTGASALGGGLFGLLGNIGTKIVGLFEAKQAFAQKKEEWSHEERLLDMQMKARAAETEQELAVTASSGSWSGLAESLKAETGIGATYPWVNAVRALVRPALTLGLAGFLCAAFFAMAPGDIDRAYVADSLVFAAVTAVVWWFGDRAPSKRIRG